jgi:hypothetical protein
VKPVVELLLERGDLQTVEQHLILDEALALTLVHSVLVRRNRGAAVRARGVSRLWIPRKHDTG